MKSASGAAARRRSTRCHERDPALGQETTTPPTAETHSLEVANHDVALQKLRPLHGETHLSGAPAAPRPVASARYNRST